MLKKLSFVLVIFLLGCLNIVELSAKPYVILKLDDLEYEHGLVHNGWQQTIEFLNQQKVIGTIGIIGRSLEKDHQPYFDWIKQRDQEGFEIWHHGFCHCQHEENGVLVKEYSGPNLEEQQESILRTHQLAKEKLGITFRSFGAPYNATDENTAKVLDSLDDIKVWMFKETKIHSNKFQLNRINQVNIEYPVHNPDFDKFKAGFNQFINEEVLVIQGHPRSWTKMPERFDEFKKIIFFLKEQNVKFITPYEYYNIYPNYLELQVGGK